MADRLAVEIEDDQDHVRISWTEGERRTAFALDVQGVEGLIELLGEARQGLRTEISRHLGEDVVIRAIDPVVCLVLTETIGSQRVLGIRHPGFGWWALPLTPELARRVAEALTEPLPERQRPPSRAQ